MWHTAEGEGYAAGRHVALEDRDELGIVGYDHESAAQVIGEEGARLVRVRVRVKVRVGVGVRVGVRVGVGVRVRVRVRGELVTEAGDAVALERPNHVDVNADEG